MDKKRTSPLRFLKWLIALGAIAALIGLASKPSPVEVDIGTVISGPMMVTIDDDGESRVRERYRITAPLAGQLLRIALDPGDTVKKDDVLATIQPSIPGLLDPRVRAQAEAATNAAEAGVTGARTQFEARSAEASQLEKAYQRNKLLHEKGNVADAAFEEAESTYLAAKHAREAAAASVEIAKFELEQAKAAMLLFDSPNDTPSSGFAVHAPCDGAVLVIDDKSARTVTAGDSLMQIGDPVQLEMRIDVLSQDAVKIKPGQKIIIDHWGGDQPLNGNVRRIEPHAYTKVSALGVDEQRVDIIADFDGAPATLADGYRIEARIVIWENPAAIQIPAGALFRQGVKWAAYKLDGDLARLTLLELGRNNGETAEVLAGLSAGDSVILHPGDRIAEGTLIRPRQ